MTHFARLYNFYHLLECEDYYCPWKPGFHGRASPRDTMAISPFPFTGLMEELGDTRNEHRPHATPKSPRVWSLVSGSLMRYSGCFSLPMCLSTYWWWEIPGTDGVSVLAAVNTPWWQHRPMNTDHMLPQLTPTTTRLSTSGTIFFFAGSCGRDRPSLYFNVSP